MGQTPSMGDCPSCSAASPDRGSAGRCFTLEVLSAFLERGDLAGLIRRSLAHFGQLFIGRDGYATVAPEKAASSTAYSAFLVLALARSELPDEVERLTRLADGIVGQQRQDGSHKVFFDDAPDSGEELYPAEAMLASRSPPPDRRYALPRQRRTRLLALQARLLRPRAPRPPPPRLLRELAVTSGPAGPSAYVVRLDGYLGLAGPGVDPDQLVAHLGATFARPEGGVGGSSSTAGKNLSLKIVSSGVPFASSNAMTASHISGLPQT